MIMQNNFFLVTIQTLSFYCMLLMSLFSFKFAIQHIEAIAPKAPALKAISFKIRTALNNIVGFANIIKNNHSSLHIKRNYVEEILFSSNHMLQTLTQIENKQKQMHYLSRDIKETLVFQIRTTINNIAGYSHLMAQLDDDVISKEYLELIIYSTKEILQETEEIA